MSLLDIREETKNFKSVDLAGLSSDDLLYTESMRIAFTLYNKALREIEEGYRDLARNSLRKAVSLYPEFGDAMLVLGICTFIGGDRIGAVRIFNAVKRPADRKRGMEILDHLANASDAAPPAIGREIRTSQIGSPLERNRTRLIPERPISEQPARRQSRVYPEQPSEELNERPSSSRNIGTHRQMLMADTQQKQEARSTVHETHGAETSGASSGILSFWNLSENRLLMLLFILLAVFTVIASAAWMSAKADNSRLRKQLRQNPVQTDTAPFLPYWESGN